MGPEKLQIQHRQLKMVPEKPHNKDDGMFENSKLPKDIRMMAKLLNILGGLPVKLEDGRVNSSSRYLFWSCVFKTLIWMGWAPTIYWALGYKEMFSTNFMR